MRYFTARSSQSRADGRFRSGVSGLQFGASGLALMAGLLASSGAQAQCTPVSASQLFPFGSGSGVNALTSVIETVNTAFLTSTSAFISAPGDPVPDQQGGGAWSRAIGGWVDTKTAGSFSFPSFTASGPNLTPICATAGTVNRETTVRQDYAGFQAGRDISVLNDSMFGANWHFGATAGYVKSTQRISRPSAGAIRRPEP